MSSLSEFGVRELMLVVGALLFIAVVIDGIRRVITQRRNELKLSKSARQGFDDGIAMDAQDAADASRLRFELPGETRVLKRTPEEVELDRLKKKEEAQEIIDLEHQNLDVPVLDRKVEPQLNFDELIKMAADQPAGDKDVSSEEESDGDKFEALSDKTDEIEKEQESSDLAHMIDSEPTNLNQPIEDVVTLHLQANDPKGFQGSELLEVLLGMNLRFGEMDIFHKRSEASTGRQVIYSVANAVEPGVFDLSKIRQFSTPCIVFFLRLPGPERPMIAFREMLDDASRMAKSLDGSVLDDHRNVLHQQTIVHISEHLQEFERKQILAAKRADGK